MRFQSRTINAAVERAALDEGYTPLQSRVIAARIKDSTVFAHGSVKAVMQPSIDDLPSPELLPDMARACERIISAINNREKIVIAADHDADGISSSFVLYSGLVRYLGVDKHLVAPLTTHRLKEGYGLSRAYLERLLTKHPDTRVVITVDQGSSNEESIAWLRERSVDCLVTDHHGLPAEGPPRSAYACVTPARSDSNYPDRSIAGCYVAYLLLQALQTRMRAQGMTGGSGDIRDLLSVVALGTVADCVDLGQSVVNRAIVQYGLRQINRGTMPAWRALRAFARKDDDRRLIVTQDISFSWAPMVNSAGRLDEAMVGLRLFLANEDESANHWAAELHASNAERKTIQTELVMTAEREARRQVAEGAPALVVFMAGGHAGIHGIVSSRLTEQFGRPTICLSPQIPYQGVLTGSVRTIDGFHVKEGLDAIQERIAPGCLISSGGHGGAGGLRVLASNLPVLREAFQQAVRDVMPTHTFEPTLHVDDTISPRIALETVDELLALDPFGRGFDSPLFTAPVNIVQVRPVGADRNHFKLDVQMQSDGSFHEGIWFNARSASLAHEPPSVPETAQLAFSVDKNVYRGRATPQLMVRGLV